jgi:hypothetical protein
VAAGDITAVRVASAAAHNGWVAEIDVDTGGSMAVGGTYAMGLGANNNPSTAKVALTVTSPGYDTTGAVTTIQRTVYGTVPMRKAAPNQAQNDEGVVSTTLTIRVALSDFIYTGDTVTAVIASGLYTQGTATGAFSGSVTNNSTLAHPKAVGRWAWPGWEKVTGDFLLEVVAFHRSAKDRKPLACVEVTVTDGTNTQTVKVTDMTVSTRDGASGAPKTLVYAATIPVAGFTQGAVLTANFKAYPWVGDSGAVLDSSAGTAQPDERLGPMKLLCDRTGAYGGAFAVVDATNGNASTATTWVASSQSAAETAYGLASSNSYQTLGHAVQAIKAYNNANYSRNNPGGGTILLTGNHSWPGVSPADQGAQDTWLTITRLSTKTRAQAVIDAGTNAGLNTQLVKVYDITLSGSSTGQIRGSNTTTNVLWIDYCDVNMTSTSSIFTWKLIHGTRNNVTALGSGWTHFSTTKAPAALVRGNVAPSSSAGTGIRSDSYCLLGNNNHRPNVVQVGNNAASQQNSLDNGVVAFNAFLNLNNIWSTVAFGGTSQTLADGIAIVQNLIEKVNGTTAIFQFYGDAIAAPSNHAIIWHNTFAGERSNIGYNDAGSTAYLHVNYSQVGNLYEVWNNKDDTFPTADGGRTGAWPVGHGVGARGNHKRASSDGGSEWDGEFSGLYTVDGGTWSFVDNAANNAGGGGDASGNGDYHLGGAATGNQLMGAGAAVLPYDLEGTQRNTANGSAGVYEMNPPVASTGRTQTAIPIGIGIGI